MNNLKDKPRIGCKDIWNAFMVSDVSFSKNSDIPICESKVVNIPVSLVSFEEAKTIYNKNIKNGNNSFRVDAFIHFYVDDQKFDGKKNSIWLYPEKALKIIKHFSGIITPDFSTCADFPDPLKRYNTYRMRAFGCWVGKNSIPVINNVRWGTIETWSYCFDGITKGEILAIGTVASGLKKKINKDDFNYGLIKMVGVLEPRAILVYGSANYPCFNKLREKGIRIVSFPSQTNLHFQKGGEQ